MRKYLDKLAKILPGSPGARGPRGDRRRKLGNRGEDIAARHLQKQGFRILDRNFSCRLGELDIVARKGDTLVFCEVKTRKTENFGAPELAVHAGKQRKIIRLAQLYMKMHSLKDLKCRFDVIAVEYKKDARPDLKHIPAAFTA